MPLEKIGVFECSSTSEAHSMIGVRQSMILEMVHS